MSFISTLTTIAAAGGGGPVGWLYTYDNSNGIYQGGIAVDTSDNVAQLSFDTNGYPTITKLDSEGTLIWRKTYNTTATPAATDFLSRPDPYENGLVSDSNDDLYFDWINGSEDRYFGLQKVLANGTLSWNKYADLTSGSRVCGVDLTVNGNIARVGTCVNGSRTGAVCNVMQSDSTEVANGKEYNQNFGSAGNIPFAMTADKVYNNRIYASGYSGYGTYGNFLLWMTANTSYGPNFIYSYYFDNGTIAQNFQHSKLAMAAGGTNLYSWGTINGTQAVCKINATSGTVTACRRFLPTDYGNYGNLGFQNIFAWHDGTDEYIYLTTRYPYPNSQEKFYIAILVLDSDLQVVNKCQIRWADGSGYSTSNVLGKNMRFDSEGNLYMSWGFTLGGILKLPPLLEGLSFGTYGPISISAYNVTETTESGSSFTISDINSATAKNFVTLYYTGNMASAVTTSPNPTNPVLTIV